ncbi:MAG: hypothetical protein LBJ97_02975 [Mycoplasmataceae bacterium]|nr:hypothetical protein [Mycoplasmataceae bacterium]
MNKQNSIIEISEIKNQDLVDKYSKIKGKRLISKDEYFLGCKDCVNRNIKGPSDFSIDNRNNSYLFAILKNLK